MAKVQELTDLFPKYDSDSDGEINQQQFSDLMTELGLPYQYPGSVNKMFRKLNYGSPQKITINLHQAIEYYTSFETPSKHDIWKAKYGLLQYAHEIKGKLKKGSNDSAAPAAPGAQTTEIFQQSPQDAKVNVLIGAAKPNYLSEIQIEVQKSEKNAKVKPFVKLVLTSSTPERAKQVETVFKENFTTFLGLVAEDISDWTEEMKNFHINSMVQGTTTTFFITTVNQELVSLIQLVSEQFELIFDVQLECKAHLKFQFQYDFEDFLKKENSNFYDIFVKQSRLSFNGKALRLFKQLKGYWKHEESMFPTDIIERMFPVALLHLQEFGVDLEFDSFGNDQEYELQTKEELGQALSEVGGFLGKLTSGGMTICTLLQLLDGSIYIQADVGQWRVKNYFRLANINKLFLNAIDKSEQNSNNDALHNDQYTQPSLDHENSSVKSAGSNSSKKSQKVLLMPKNSIELPSDSESDESIKKEQTDKPAAQQTSKSKVELIEEQK